MNALRHVLATTAVIVCDLAFVTAGSFILWFNGGTTVVDGPWYGFALMIAVATLLTMLRTITAGQRPFATLQHPARERVVSIVETLILAGLIGAWRILDSYLLGWIATFATLSLLCMSVLQALTDVLTARNSHAARNIDSRVLRRRIRSLETQRILIVILAITAVVLTSPIHSWMPSLINPLLVLIVIPIGAGVGIASVSHLTQTRQSPVRGV